MKAALLYGKEDLRVEDVKKPCIGDNEVLLKVKSAFVCGTDVRMFKNSYSGIGKQSPLILGHEISGIIEQVGKHVKEYKNSMRVVVAPNMGCGLCDECISGNTQLCKDYLALGIHCNGGFAEYVRIPSKAVKQGNIIELPETVSFEEAALAEPLSCVYNAFERSNIQPADTVLVIGAGPIGIMHAKLARTASAAEVIISDLSLQRLELCRRIDSSFITVASDYLKDKVMGLTNKRGVDVCITACPSPEAQKIALDLAAMNGRVVFFGGLPHNKCEVSLNTNLIHYKQLIVTGTTRSSLTQFRKALKLISENLVYVNDLITGRFEVDNIAEAIVNAQNGIGLKNMIGFDLDKLPEKSQMSKEVDHLLKKIKSVSQHNSAVNRKSIMKPSSHES